MNNEKALSILITGCRIAQSKGVFTLEDASVILEAIKVFAPAVAPIPPAPEAGVPSPKEFLPEEPLDKVS